MIAFKNYELMLVMILIISVIFMVVAFVKITIEHEEDLEKKEKDDTY